MGFVGSDDWSFNLRWSGLLQEREELETKYDRINMCLTCTLGFERSLRVRRGNGSPGTVPLDSYQANM